jgi:hypothetical protein
MVEGAGWKAETAKLATVIDQIGIWIFRRGRHHPPTVLTATACVPLDRIGEAVLLAAADVCGEPST